MSRVLSLENLPSRTTSSKERLNLSNEEQILVREVEILLQCLEAQLPEAHQDPQTKTRHINMDLVTQPRFILFPGLK